MMRHCGQSNTDIALMGCRRLGAQHYLASGDAVAHFRPRIAQQFLDHAQRHVPKRAVVHCNIVICVHTPSSRRGSTPYAIDGHQSATLALGGMLAAPVRSPLPLHLVPALVSAIPAAWCSASDCWLGHCYAATR